MKAVLVNGDFHGKVLRLLEVPKLISLPIGTKEYRWITGGSFDDERPVPVVNVIHYSYSSAWPNVANPTVIVYSAPTADVAGVSAVFRLQHRLASKDPLVALNEWLDDNLSGELAYDANLRQRLFPLAAGFEMSVAEISGQRAAERLCRRFGQTF